MGSEIWKRGHLKYGQATTILSKNNWKSGQKYPDFEWYSFQMVGTIAIAVAKAQPFDWII